MNLTDIARVPFKIVILIAFVLMSCKAKKENKIFVESDVSHSNEVTISIKNQLPEDICIRETDTSQWELFDKNGRKLAPEVKIIEDSYGIHRHIAPNKAIVLRRKPWKPIENENNIYSIKLSIPIYLCNEIDGDEGKNVFHSSIDSEGVHHVIPVNHLSADKIIQFVQVKHTVTD